MSTKKSRLFGAVLVVGGLTGLLPSVMTPQGHAAEVTAGADDIGDIFSKSNSMRPIEGFSTCKPCFNCQCDRTLIPVTLCEDVSCWFYGLPVKRGHQHRPRCCTPRPPEIPFDDPCPTRPRPLPLPGPSTPWPWLDPRVMSNPRA